MWDLLGGIAREGFSVGMVLGETLAPFMDAQAMISLLVLILFSMIFAHFFWISELGGDDVFNDEYGPGIVDAFWYSIVTALTLGKYRCAAVCMCVSAGTETLAAVCI